MKSKEYNVHSQYGEDGILEFITERLNLNGGYFIEFGAWDGRYMSNTCLLAERGWKGIFIEAEKEKYELLQITHKDRDLEFIHAFVTPEGVNSLDNIIDNSRFKNLNPTVLSIDIDSDDLAIWMSLSRYRPSIVVIEYNLTIPPDVSFINLRGLQIGNSARAIYDHAKRNNYIFVHQTEGNMIFLDQSIVGAEYFKDLDFLCAQENHNIRYFFGYDGSFYRSSSKEGVNSIEINELTIVPWTHALMRQPISRFFRKSQRSNRIYYALMIFLNYITTFLCSPIEFCSYVFSKRNRIDSFVRSLFSRGT